VCGRADANPAGTRRPGTLFATSAVMSWFRVSAERLEYCGRITREPFTRWLGTKEGTEAVARLAGGIRFSLLGRTRAARRRMWRQLNTATRSGPLAQAIRQEASHYMTHAANLSYALTLPRAHIALHRLVVVPRALMVGRARAALYERLHRAPMLADFDEALRKFFLEQLVTEMGAAVDKTAPSPKYPVKARDEWACVGVAAGTVWLDRFWSGPNATGHLFMYEFPREKIGRRERKALDAAIKTLHAEVTRLPALQRNEILRLAADQGNLRRRA